MWDEAFAATENNSLSVTAELFVTSINQLIDIKTERDIATSNDVPEIVLLGLLLFATLAIGILRISSDTRKVSSHNFVYCNYNLVHFCHRP